VANLRELGRTLRPGGAVDRLPRAGRAYVAGFGTSGSLLAVAVLLFIVASALVAFRGWPHVGAQPSPGEVVVAPRSAAETGSAAERRLAAVSAAPVAGPGAGTGTVVRGVRGVRGGAAPGTRRSIGTPASASLPARASLGGSLPACVTGCGAAPAGGSPPAVGAAPRPVQQLQQTTQQDLQRATGTLAKVVGDTGAKVATTVRQTTTTAAGAVQTVSPQAAGVVKSTGSGAGSLVGGLTNTAVGALSGIGGH
jgi:hypothetical protein